MDVDTIELEGVPAAALAAPEPAPVPLEEVIVTSQKIEQTLREVPASVSVIDGEFIRQAKVQTINDINGYTPNTQIRVVPFAGEVRIRGYGTPPSNLGFESSVGAVIDDVYYGRTPFLSAVMYDIDRFEIVRGPQGALFGKNTIAGVLNVASKPVSPDPTGDVMLTIAGAQTRDVRAGLTVPLSESFGMRFAATDSRDEGLYANSLLDRREGDVDGTNTRLKFAWQPTDAIELRFSAFVSEQSANSNLFQLGKATEPMLAFLRNYDPEVEADPHNERLSSNVLAHTQNTLYGGQLVFDYDLPTPSEMNLTTITAYAAFDLKERSLDFDASPAPFLALAQARPSPYDQYSQEIRLVGRLGPHFGTERSEYILGLFGFYSDYGANDQVILEDLAAAAGYVVAARAGGAPGESGAGLTALLGRITAALDALPPGLPLISETALLTLDQETTSYAAFGQITSWLTDRFAVIAGLRLGREEKDGHLSSDGNGAIFLPLVTGQSDHVSDIRRDEREVSPKLGLKYEFGDAVATYATWARGFKSGGFNALPLNDENLAFGPEKADSYELGVKARILDGTLQSNFAAYLTDFNNLQVSAFTGTTFAVLNAAAARAQGFEADLRWLSPWPATELRAAVGYNDAHYRSYPGAPAPGNAADNNEDGRYDCPSAADSPGAALQSGACTQDLSGRVLSLAPKWTASITPTVGIPGFSDGWGFQLALDYLYTSKRYLDVDLDPVTLQPSTSVINARLSAGSIAGTWSISFGAQNLTGEEILGQLTDVPAAPGNYQAVRMSRGRQYFGLLRFQF